MGGGNLMNRAVAYFLNQVLVNGLANSPAFQRLAVRTSKGIEQAIQKKHELAEKIKDISKNMESFKNQ